MTPQRQQTFAFLIPFGVALLSFALSAYAASTNNTKALTERIATIEAKQEDDRRRLGEIKSTVDQIYSLLIQRGK